MPPRLSAGVAPEETAADPRLDPARARGRAREASRRSRARSTRARSICACSLLRSPGSGLPSQSKSETGTLPRAARTPLPTASQSRAAPQRLGFSHVFSLSKWRTVLRSLLKNRYRTTYRCYSFSETSRHGAFSAAYGASNRHHGGECDLGEGRHRLVGSTSMRSFSVVPLLPRSLSLHDVAVAREVLLSARLMSLRSPRRVMIRRFDDRIWV